MIKKNKGNFAQLLIKQWLLEKNNELKKIHENFSSYEIMMVINYICINFF